MRTVQNLRKRVLFTLLAIVMAFAMLPYIPGLQTSAWAASSGTTIDMSDTNPPSNGTNWTFNSASKVYTISNNAKVTVSGTSADERRIEVALGATATITLNGADIGNTNVLGDGEAALSLGSGAKVTLILTNSSSVAGAGTAAGILTTGATLTINGSGSLTAQGGSSGAGGEGGAGIGGGRNGASGTTINGGSVTINSGTITAIGGDSSAGIGGGASIGTSIGGAGGTITINGGTVTARGDVTGAAAAIGGAYNGAGGTITINGGTVEADGNGYVGIGYGKESAGGTTTINGGTVRTPGCNICSSNGVTITGGSVMADIQPQPTSDGSTPVYCNALYNTPNFRSAAITDIYGVSYGIKDVKATNTGFLWFWLPASAASELIAVSKDGTNFYGAEYQRETNNNKQQQLTLSLTREATPSATIDYANEKLTGLVAGADYTIGGAPQTADGSGCIAIDSAWVGTAISIVKIARGAAYLDSAAQSLSIPARPVTPTKLKVKFNANGGKIGKAKTKSVKVSKGKAIGKLPKVAKRAKHTFKGWYTAKGGGSKVTTKTKVKKNITLYAHWKAKTKYGKVINATAVYVRKAPSSHGDSQFVVGHLKKGQTFKVQGFINKKGTSKDWYRLTYQGKTAYVYAKYVKVVYR